ncbi:hypothetical protein [Undibacterium terreum]|uniref:hypothetical protein n=1 Tax=Undibacterium terreum TaxID=1224302 RepID=UPI001664A865|nr:hypothetical protein [Undibacterium terreum]
MRILFNSFRLLLLLILLFFWACNFPHYQISDFIGAHFPWPTHRQFKWLALLSEGLLVQLTCCLPTMLLLVAVFRKSAVWVAMALASLFLLRTAVFEFWHPIKPPDSYYFAGYLAACHLLLLAGGSLLVQRRLDRSGKGRPLIQ